jgi:hypothetical protein
VNQNLIWFSFIVCFSHTSDIGQVSFSQYHVSSNRKIQLLLHCNYSPLWALPCRTIPFHFFLSVTNSLHLLTPSTWRSLSTSSIHPFLRLSHSSRPFQFLSEDLFGASYPPPFPPGSLTNLPFATLSTLLYFLLCSSLLVLDSSYFSIPRFHI